MRLLDTSSRLATSAIRVAANPRSITTWHVTSRISMRRSATVGFFTTRTIPVCVYRDAMELDDERRRDAEVSMRALRATLQSDHNVRGAQR